MVLTITAGFKEEIECIKIEPNEWDDDVEIDVVQDISYMYICFEKGHYWINLAHLDDIKTNKFY